MSLTCKQVMLSEQVTLKPDDTVSKAFNLMHQNGMRFLPVIDDDGRYMGVFTSPTLIRLLLPAAMTIQMSGKKAKGLHNLGFYSLDQADLKASLSEVKDEKVSKHLSKPENIPVIAPDTSIMEGILLLHQYKRHVILVEPETNQFVGVLSINAVLRTVFDEDYTV